MPRSIAAFAITLTLVTGLVVGSLISLDRPAMPLAAVTDRESAQAARSFYAAINHYLETGDAGVVERSLSPGYIGHTAYSAAGESPDVFLHYLESIRSTFPSLRLEVRNVSAQAGVVAMDVGFISNAAGTFGGLPLDAGAGTSGYEVLRVEGGQIVERWASRAVPPIVESRMSTNITIPDGSHLEARVERLTFGAKGSGTFSGHDQLLVVGERGAVSWRTAGSPDQDRDPESGEQTEGTGGDLLAGQSIAVPADASLHLVNHEVERASVLMISIRQAQFGMGQGQIEPDEVIASIGLERRLLAGGSTPHTGAMNDAISVIVGKIVLPPGSVVARHEVVGAELLVVMQGAIDAAVHQGSLVCHQPDGGFEVVDNQQTIGAGQGARANPGTVVEYRSGANEPATVWFVTISGDTTDDPEEPATT
jgi:predicted ester cyclase